MTTMRADLCRADDGRGDGPYLDEEGLPIWLTCPDKGGPPDSFPCTGSKHQGGVEVICVCPCHDRRPVAEKDREARRW